MPACWCRARMSRYGRARATAFPAPGRRRGRYCRTAKSRMRASSARSRGLGRVWRGQASYWHSILILIAQAADEVGQVRGHAFIDYVVVNGAELLPDPSLDFATQTRGWLVLRGGWPLHWLLCLCAVGDRGHRFDFGVLWRHHVVFSPFAHCRSSLWEPSQRALTLCQAP